MSRAPSSKRKAGAPPPRRRTGPATAVREEIGGQVVSDWFAQRLAEMPAFYRELEAIVTFARYAVAPDDPAPARKGGTRTPHQSGPAPRRTTRDGKGDSR